ncbi:MAG TPA: transcriptional regulator, partial [Arthrobacter bacterium]|nr:transcriptional regulator [Arthrobacter sp.]
TIANRLKNIDPANVNFITVPNVPAPADPNRLTLDEPAASDFFAALRKSPDLTQAAPAGTPSEAPATPPAPAYDKALQPISVANGTGVTGRSTAIASLVAQAGFTKVTRIQATARPQTMVYFGPGFADVAADVAAMFGLPASSVQQVANIQGVQLYAGEDFATGDKPTLPSADPGSVVAQTAQDQTCQATNTGG